MSGKERISPGERYSHCCCGYRDQHISTRRIYPSSRKGGNSSRSQKGNFEHAAEVYKEFATHGHVYFHQYAGLAFKRCGGDLHHLAEESYLKALFYTHAMFLDRWNVNDEEIQGTYASPKVSCDNKPCYMLVGALMSMLHICCFRIDQDEALDLEFRYLVSAVGSLALKPQFKSPSQARNALIGHQVD
jgi:hypothetical protein